MKTIKAWALVNKVSGNIEYNMLRNQLCIGLKRFNSIEPEDNFEFRECEIKIL